MRKRLFDITKQRASGITDLDRAAAIDRFLRERTANYAPQIARTLVDKLRFVLREGAQRGARISDMQASVRSILIDQAPFRALRIVRTEVVGALNRGAQDSYMASPVVGKKRWLTAKDGRVRVPRVGMPFDHVAADGQEVPKDQPFVVGGQNLMHPGDPSGSAGNIVNCRCTMVPVVSKVTPPTPSVEPEGRPRQLTEAEIQAEFLDKAKDPTARRWMERSLLEKRFREKVMIAEHTRGTASYAARDIGDDAWGQFWARDSSVELNSTDRHGLGKQSIKTRASVIAHEMFHGTTYNRGWFSRRGKFVQLKNPEAGRLLELYNNTLDRVEKGLDAKSKDPSGFFSNRIKRDAKKSLNRIRSARKRKNFARSYTNGLPWWKDMRDTFVLEDEAMGIPRAYSLHSPAEYATTSFEKYVFEPKKLQRRDPDMFEFFDSFYRDGVFKRMADILKELEWPSQEES